MTRRVVVAGGHGGIGLRLLQRLAERGDEAVGLVRNPDHEPDLEAVGATAAVLDLESADVEAVAAVVTGADAVYFAAGAGPGSGAARKLSMDRDGAITLADAAARAGVSRYLMVSSMGAVEPTPGQPADEPDTVSADDVFEVYLRAKGAADAGVRERVRDWVVLRPGGLTDDPASGRVNLATSVPRGSVSRDDVADVLLALDDAGVSGVTVELVGGDTPVADAVAALRG